MDTTKTVTCDGCGESVRAKVIVSLPSGNTLAYCFHHANQYREKLTGLGAFLYTVAEP